MLTRSLFRRALVGLAVIGATSVAHGQEALKYKWSKGEVLYYRTLQETKTKTTAMGMEQVREKREEMVQRFEVKDVGADGLVTVDVSTLSVKVDEDQGGAKFSFDSSRPADKQYDGPPNSRAGVEYMGLLVGEHFTAQIDPSGAVRKVEGMAKIIDKMIAKVGNDPRVSANLRATFGDEAARGMMDRNFKILPDNAVKQGDSWTQSYEQQIPRVGGKMKIDTTTTFAGIEKKDGADVAKFTGVLVIDDVPPKEGEPTGPAKTSIEGGKGTSERFFDSTNGKLVKSYLELILPIEAQLSRDGQPGFTMKNDTTSKITFERVPEPAKSEGADAAAK